MTIAQPLPETQPFQLSVQQQTPPHLSINITIGEVLFILGANGTGKSSMMHRFYTSHQNRAKRITAHRRTWFSSNSLDITPKQKDDLENTIQTQDRRDQARWSDDYAPQRSSIAIFDLVDAENVRARAIAAEVDNKRFDLAEELSKKDAPIKVINSLLRQSNIPIEISVVENSHVVASKAGSPSYSIAQLSDGERNSLLLAAQVLTSKAGTLFLIDEPERHLHHSIVSPLLTLLFAERPDCAFIVSTHNIGLPLENPDAKTLLIRGCHYSGTNVSSWDADLVTPTEGLDDQIRKDILGARKKLLFVEGEESSLDKPLYSILFPKISIVAKASASDVERAVIGIRDAQGLHWVEAYGIVDNDKRGEANIENLRGKGVYALSAYSVESIYYHPEIQRRIAERQQELIGQRVDTALANAKNAAISAFAQQKEHLSVRMAEKLTRREFFSNLPTRKDIAAKTSVNVSIDVNTLVQAEEARLQGLLDNDAYAEIIQNYPIRETGALGAIAKALGFQNASQYQKAVRKLLVDDSDSLNFVQAMFGGLKSDLS